MEDLDALLADLETTASHLSLEPAPHGTHGAEAAAAPPGLGELDRLLRDLNATQSCIAGTQSAPNHPKSPQNRPKSPQNHLKSPEITPKSPEITPKSPEITPNHPKITYELLAPVPPPQPPAERKTPLEAPEEGAAPEGGGLTPNCGFFAPKLEGFDPNPVSPPPGPRPPPAPPSAATQDLDELMASLSLFHLQHQRPPSVGQDLDSMLRLLQKDLDRKGVPMGGRGACGGCLKPIAGKALLALGRWWHPRHFRCAACGQALAESAFFEREGAPYCPEDYGRLFAPSCAACERPILHRMVTALERDVAPGARLLHPLRGGAGGGGFPCPGAAPVLPAALCAALRAPLPGLRPPHPQRLRRGPAGAVAPPVLRVRGVLLSHHRRPLRRSQRPPPLPAPFPRELRPLPAAPGGGRPPAARWAALLPALRPEPPALRAQRGPGCPTAAQGAMGGQWVHRWSMGP
ncbi:uncharacterized protein ACIB01_019432 [Guaruba guarouba]